ncbi:putative electron transport protein YsaA [Escherichia coli DEC12A]|uniref:Electron transport protein ygfS n=1 Tax=Escherichia coli TaxID=562 RepID=A0A2X3A0W7_ECOLX|nr:putative electron transport protein YsaA [Escherichia coli DEC12A]EHX29079.1 putative electron transport protein YsaA [Escherichia coli DEC12C]EHX46519.1 putative electron transport protein YsaA [Escherichia coli DEC12E]SQB76681.1 electron transport protein ygfS [Escherichia coli]SQB82417.1 electron transport protein ygfS [Escherichia coli]
MKSLIIVNPADCIGCRTCEVACVVAHPSEQELNADVFLPRLKVQRLDSISVKTPLVLALAPWGR